jgi:hypothetical protein
VGNRDFAAVFQQLKAGLQQPLTGMGTAFSSSLFGLGGSLVLGFLDILAGHAQNRFFNDLEEWLSGVTQLIDEPGSQPLIEDADNLEQRLSQQLREKQHQRRQAPPADDAVPPADDAVPPADDAMPPPDDTTATARPGAGDD